MFNKFNRSFDRLYKKGTNIMNYSADKPIENSKKDLLHRSSFSKYLGEAIHRFNGEDGLVIGVYGKWGTGKTSVLNMAIEEAEALSKQDKNEQIILRFNPWNFSDNNNLISLFFCALENIIKKPENKELRKKIGKALCDYSAIFDTLSLIPIIGSGMAVVLKTLARVHGSNLMHIDNLDTTKEKLNKALKDANKKIIVVIDDIDRLTNMQIRNKFQLVKQVADFHNVIYILSMDREVVVRALSEMHYSDGDKYLEKIVQVNFEIPEIPKATLKNIFLSKLKGIACDNVEYDDRYLDILYKNCIAPKMQTVRDVNRVINSILFRYEIIREEVLFEDMVAITAIEVLEPELYKWIYNNKGNVCKTKKIGTSNNNVNVKSYENEFVKIGVDSDFAINCVRTLFQSNSENSDDYAYLRRLEYDISKRMRIAFEERFELYFRLNMNEIKVQREIIEACISEYNNEKLRKTLLKEKKNGNLEYLIKEIGELVTKIPNERLSLISIEIFNLREELRKENPKNSTLEAVYEASENLIDGILEQINSLGSKYKIISSLVKSVNNIELGLIAKKISLIDNQMKKDMEDIKQFNDFKEIYLSKISELIKEDKLLNINEFYYGFSIFRKLDKDGAEKYIEKIFSNDITKLKFICAFFEKWERKDYALWQLLPREISEYVMIDEIYEVIDKLDKNRLDQFTEIEQIKLASFILGYRESKNKGGESGINGNTTFFKGRYDLEIEAREDEARELVDKWAKRENNA